MKYKSILKKCENDKKNVKPCELEDGRIFVPNETYKSYKKLGFNDRTILLILKYGYGAAKEIDAEENVIENYSYLLKD